MDSSPATNTLLKAALAYAARGWPVFPCHVPLANGCSCRNAQCTNIGKHPRTTHGLSDATADTASIQKWWTRWPDANIAIATGAKSGLVVLDEDSYKGGDASRRDLEQTYAPLPETIQQLTGGGGVQFFFAHPGTHVKNGVEKLGVGLDVRGDGGYVIAPPSLHVSGKKYVWELSHEPDDTPLAPLPDWLLALCQESDNRRNAELLDVGTIIPKGARNDTLFRAGSGMRRRGFSEAVILAGLLEMNQTQCHPPLPDADIRTIATSCAQYTPETPQNGRDVPMMTSPLPSTPGNNATVLAMIAHDRQPPAYWFATATLHELHAYRHDPAQWGKIRATAKRQGIDPWDLDKAVDASPPEVDALLESLRFPFVSTGPHIPPLPHRARQDIPTSTTWLDDYAAHSAYWAPRAAPAYHQAVGLWVLSTIAARRIMVEMGSTAVYPTLFLALVSESTHWTKTTAASIGIRLLRRAGCGHLLAPDRTTPQFLLKLMSGLVPQNYGSLDDEEQTRARDVLGFSAQRGWFYEEWGGMLHQMRRVDSPHAELNKLLIVLEGGAETFETGTIQRGLERINNPYLALLGNATPHDLAPFMGEGNPWWHDGFWPRFVCVAPPYGAQPSRAPRPREAYQLPGSLITPVNEWHRRLGTPSVTVTEEREANGKLTGAWIATIGTLPCQKLTVALDVYDAYETYNDALLEMVHAGDIPSDLSPWYGRAHEKALRVAMLLASVHGEHTITLPYWSKGQAMAETWRRSLHEAIATMAETAPLSREAQLEAKIESLCTRTGGLTARELQRHIKGSSSDVIHKALTGMVKIGTLLQSKAGKNTLYSILSDEHSDGES